MDADESGDAPARPRRSLRRRWGRRMAAGLVVMVLGSVVTVGAFQHALNAFRDSARRFDTLVAVSARLRADIVAHTNVGHNLIEAESAETRRRAATLEAAIRADLVSAAGHTGSAEARRWFLAAEDRWAGAVAEIRPVPAAERVPAHEALADAAEDVTALVDRATVAAGRAERDRLATAERLEGLATAVMVGAGVALMGLGVLLARRLTVEVLVPVAALRDSADRLAAGDLDHRASIHGPDELGELAARFNAMADALATRHRDLAHRADHDAHTGLANRAAFRQRLDAALAHPPRRDGTQAVVFVDLDDFKNVNDTLGHTAGDELLAVVAERLVGAVRPGDLVARLGGDEFAVLLDGVGDGAAAVEVAERVVAAAGRPVRLGSSSIQVGASAGLAMRSEGIDGDELMRRADVAMYQAKGAGKNRVQRFDAALEAAAAEHRALETHLHGVAGRGELVIEYQPVVDLATGVMVATEALIRWQHPTRGLLEPAAFIGAAENCGAVVEIGEWVLEQAVHQLRRWQGAFDRPDLAVSVNVSPLQLDERDFVERVREVLGATGVEPDRLVLEITEGVLAEPDGRAAGTVAAIRRLGVRIALDDFGTGYSSIGYLRRLPVDILKIDRAFVSGDHAVEAGGVLLEAIVALGQRLGLDVVPEGIEAPDQLARLRRLGCRVGQGFLLGVPASPAALDALLAVTGRWLPAVR